MTLTAGAPHSSVDSPTAPVVLFVDDEQQVLDALRTSLRRQRRTYDFLFVSSVAEAIAVLTDRHVDVVVTDMRMPGATGIDLLRYIHAEHPEIVRYVLSGEAERDLVLEATRFTHRWLTKPCDRDLLVAALADAVQYRALLGDSQLMEVMTTTDVLASPPGLYTEICDAIADEDTTIAHIVEMTEADPGISAKLLQWANSAFSGGKRVSDLHGAIMRIGLESLAQLVLSAEIMRLVQPTVTIPGLEPTVFHQHVDAAGKCAERLTSPEHAMIARVGSGLAYVGLLLEAGSLPDRLTEAYDFATEANISLVAAERELFGVTHPEIGGYLLALWGLPSELVSSVRQSHDLPVAPIRGSTLSPGEAVQVGRLLAQRLPHGAHLGRPHVDDLDEDLEESLMALAVCDQEDRS